MPGPMRIISARDHRRMPWKNGGGVTTEIAIAPQGAALDAFDWRISTAHVASDGPFSLFPEIDRTLAVLTGEGVILDIAGRGSARLDRATPPYAFPGDVPIASRLIGGAIDDLNVMTRRGRFRHHLTRRAVAEPFSLERRGDVTVVVLAGADAVATGGGETFAIADGDSVIVDSGEDRVVIAPRAPAQLHIVDLWRC